MKTLAFLHFGSCERGKLKPGFGLIEIIIVVSMMMVTVVAFGQVARVALSALQNERTRLEASLLMEEGFEGLRALRDQSWSTNIAGLANGTTYYLATTTAGSDVNWSLLATPPTKYTNNKYWRTLVFAEVTRNASDQIASSGTADAGTRKLTVTVSWAGKTGTSSVAASGYLANILQN